MQPIRPVTLADDVVSLEPLGADHAQPLWEAASGPRDTFVLTRVPASLEAARAYVEVALQEQARGVSVPFVTRDARSGKVVGSTRFMTIERWTWPPGHPMQRTPDCADAVEIGATWLAPAAQRTATNTHAKLLMLTHAFEAWEVLRVTLKTDARNLRSRAAIERIGGSLDGVLRAHMPGFDGAVRDTAFYSILAGQWSVVREALRRRTTVTGSDAGQHGQRAGQRGQRAGPGKPCCPAGRSCCATCGPRCSACKTRCSPARAGCPPSGRTDRAYCGTAGTTTVLMGATPAPAGYA